MKWIRYRFYSQIEDYRPVLFNPAYPWWCTGYTDESAIIIAYLPIDEPLLKYWPEAESIDSEHRELFFSDRFPKPEYYDPDYEGPSMGIQEYQKYFIENHPKSKISDIFL